MASLGSFGAALREREPDRGEAATFDFCGKTFTVTGEIPAILELTLVGGVAGKVSGFETQVALYEALRFALSTPAPDDGGEADMSQWDEFSKLAVDNRVQQSVLSEIAFRIMGYLVGRPTEQQSDSSPGLLPTGTNSNSSSSATPDSPASSPAGAGSTG